MNINNSTNDSTKKSTHKSLFIAEKPSVAMEFAKALDMNLSSSRKDGYVEDDQHIVTWCVGHLIGMMYPEAYGEEFKKWSFDTLPFIPKNYKYGVCYYKA